MDALRARLSEGTSRGLADAVSAAIRDGELAEGDQLPPIRSVARELSLSATTVSAAWNLLARAGTIRTDGRRGTTVSLRTVGPTRYRRALQRRDGFTLDLSAGVPDPALLPALPRSLPALSRTRARATYLDEPALPELIEVVAEQWPYSPERFTVVDGAMDALQQIVHSTLRYGSRVLVEHPCFPPFLDLLASVGSRIVGVQLDGRGMVPNDLAGKLAGADMLLLQPRAQNPTGVSMDAERAAELSAVLGKSDVLVVEDDSTGPLSDTPMISLGEFLPGQTLHIRSYSKSHGPDLRIAVLSGPSELVGAVIERRYLGQGWTSQILQGLLHFFLTDDATIAVVDTARTEYAHRRTTMKKHLAARGVDTIASDGINLWVPVRDEVAAMVRLAGNGIGVAAGNAFMVLPDDRPHLRVTAGVIADRHELIAETLADASDLRSWSSAR